MKKILITALLLAGITATAQVKVGSNPTTIDTGTTNFQVEGITTAEQFVVLKNGNVGIGTTTANWPLTISGASASINVDRFGGAPHFIFRQANGTQAAPTATVANALIGRFSAWAYDGTQYLANGYFDFIAKNNVTTTTRSTDLAFSVANGTEVNELMRLSGSNASVGIGTSTPGNKLHVYGTVLNGGETVMKLSSADGGWSQGTGDGVSLDFAQWNSSVSRVKAGVWSGSGNFDLGFMTGLANVTSDTPQMILTPNGSVGIGTTAPDQQLEVAKTSLFGTNNAMGEHAFRWKHNASAETWFMSSGKAGVSSTSTTIGTISSGALFQIEDNGNVGIGTPAFAANKLDVFVTAAGDILRVRNNTNAFSAMLGTNANAAYLNTDNTALAFTLNGTEAMRIQTSTLNVGIGTNDPTSKLQVVGLPVYADNAAAITAGLTAGAFYHTGDGIVRVVF